MVRLAPGFGTDERALDPRFSKESRREFERQRGVGRNPLAFYLTYVGRLVRGDAGRSIAGEPVMNLIRERAPTTLRIAGWGLAIGWWSAAVAAALAALERRVGISLSFIAMNGLILSIPSAVLATLCLLLRLEPYWAVGAIVFARVFPHFYEQLRSAADLPHVTMARAKGLRSGRIFLFHVAPAALPAIAGMFGVTVALALGTSVPVEALGDYAGLGQLAWNAALARDMPVLVAITLLLAIVTVAFTTLTDLLVAHWVGAQV